jgi:signal transduction histidine kinase
MTDRFLFDSISPEFLKAFGRICLLVSLGHFMAVPILYIYLQHLAELRTLHYQFIIPVTMTGIVLCMTYFLMRVERFRGSLSLVSFGMLSIQIAYFMVILKNPLSLGAFFIALALLSPVFLGNKASLAFAVLSLLVVSALFFLGGTNKNVDDVLVFLLFTGSFVISVFVGRILWAAINTRDARLRKAMAELEEKHRESETWIQQLFSCADSIRSKPAEKTTGKVVHDLTGEMPQALRTVSEYFSSLQLSSRMQSLGVLATGIAHELNTPLAALRFIVDRTVTDGTVHAELVIEINRMKTITRDLLSFARPDQKEELVDLNTLIRNTADFFHRMSPGLSIQTHLWPEPLMVQAVPDQFRQILISLFENARDALGKNSNRSVVMTSQREDERALVSVTDNGCGMDEYTLAHAMEPFFTTKEPGKGTGMGLFIAQGLLQKHGGWMEIQSVVMQYTTVRLFFPLASPSSLNKESTLATQELERKAA